MVRIVPQRRSAIFLRRAAEGAGPRTIAVAFLANIVIAVAKLLAGLASGSTGMLAEAAHSVADSVNEVFLYIGLQRQRQPADVTHPFGHGRERFLWAFMAAMASFLVGGCLSVALAVADLRAPHPAPEGIWPWIVLAVSFVAEGTSWRQGVRQARAQAKEFDVSTWRYLQQASDPIVRAVVVEDSAALIGLILAACGLVLSQALHTHVPDALASLAIGLLLAVTAFGVARPTVDFLVGRSLPAPLFERLNKIVREDPAIGRVLSLRATYLGPEEVIVGAKVHPAERLGADEFARAMDELDHRIRRELPVVSEVFIDASAHPTEDLTGAG